MLQRRSWCRAGDPPRHSGFAALLALALGCGSSEPEPAPRSAAQEAVPPAPAAPAHGPYELHEWGFIASSMRGSTSLAVSSPLGVPRVGAGLGTITHGGGTGFVHGIGKPVLYFHLDEGTDSLELSVGVSTEGRGSIVEHFPPGELGADGGALRWPAVRVTRGACRGTYPGLADPACQRLDGICEAAELPGYESDAADCVRVGEHAGGVLLYRTGALSGPLPLRVEHADGGALRVTHADPEAAPALRPGGWVMRILRGADRASTRVSLATLGTAASVLVPPAAGEGSLGADEGLARLREALAAAGLDAPEQAAFLGAWSDALFGEQPPQGGPDGLGLGAGALDGAAPPGRGGTSAGYAPPSARRQPFVGLGGGLGGGASNAPEHPLGSVPEALVYLLPEAHVDALLPLRLEPAPRAQRRVFLARVSVEGPLPTLTFLPALVAGDLDPDAIRRVFLRRRSVFAACLPEGEPSERFTLRLRVLTTGGVERATLDGLGPRDPRRACLLEAAQRLAFPGTDTISEVTQVVELTR